MENQQNNPNTEPTTEVIRLEPKRSWWKYAIGVSLVVVFVVGGYAIWYLYFSPDAQYIREIKQSTLELPGKIEAYKKAREADTYGGATPEETLQMFIEALRNEDIELAYKYFALKDDTTTRDENILKNLNKFKNEGKLQQIANELKGAKLTDSSDILNNTWFTVYDNEGSASYQILLQLNKYSGVWKIESL